MAASPRNRFDSLLSPGPEGCVHSSELLLGLDEGCSSSERCFEGRKGQEVTACFIGSQICVIVDVNNIF